MTDLVQGIRARIGLVRSCGFGTGLGIRMVDGAATLYGKVASQVERERAERAIRGISGIRELWSLVRVVEGARRSTVERTDATLRTTMDAKSRTDERLRGIGVVSVDDGVVLLTGRAANEQQRSQAIEAVRACRGVRDVASLIRVA